ncbi:acid protease [Wolfiporia cocos MD-104 SS10]|uniref:Acid protease n=1 Tax=Wolfiporia cocos (strain MD-104) TaxID=742152 RepID=A0A2H3J1P3_WOLCO|nr:acid protease [Wolfiporia cocos MD-104 SS10]
MGPCLVHLLLLGYVLHCWGHPLQSPKRENGSYVARIRRPASRYAYVNSSSVFDPTYAMHELKAVLAKYARADQFLAGVGLNPDTHADASYHPFTFTLANVTNATSSQGNCTGPCNATSGRNATSHNATMQLDLYPLSVDVTNPNTSSDAGSAVGLPGTTQVPLEDDVAGGLDILYYGALQFGSQRQTLTVDIDTGSADLWVPVNCRACGGDSFRSSQSTTYKSLAQRFSVTYGAGKVTGTLAQDSVAIGGLEAEQQAFGAVRSESDDFYDQPSDGLLGLAFGTIAQSKRPTLFESLMLSKQVTAAAFSVHLERGHEEGSAICIGCYDTTKAIGPVTWNPVISRVSTYTVVDVSAVQTYWSIQLSGLSAWPGHTTYANLTAAIDTGTTLIYLPDAVAESFYALIPGSRAAMQYGAGFYTFPCSSSLAVSLLFSGKSYSVSPQDFNLGRTFEDSPDCVGGILALGKGFPQDLAIIGYSIYDYAGNRVGFSPSVNQNLA